MSEINKDFRQRREELNLSQQDAAILLGVSRVMYNQYENQPDTMPLGRYEKLMSEFERLEQLTEQE